MKYSEMMDELKNAGEVEKKTIEEAEMVSEIIFELTEARIRKGLSQRELAKLCGIKQSAIARMEKVQVVPRLDTLAKIANALDVEIKIEEKECEPEEEKPYIYIIDARNRFGAGNCMAG